MLCVSRGERSQTVTRGTRLADYSADDERLAGRIVARLFDEGSASNADFLATNISLLDIEIQVSEFLADLEILERIGADSPATVVGDLGPVPIALSELFGKTWPGYPSRRGRGRSWDDTPHIYDLVAKRLYDKDAYRDAKTDIVNIPRDNATEIVRRGMTDFLAVRVAAVKAAPKWYAFLFGQLPVALTRQQFTNGPSILTQGCNFLVETDTRDLRVFRSGVFRISSQYFGYPTSPAIGVLESGTYIFGVDGKQYGNNIQWDRRAVVRLPGPPSVHLNY